MRLGLRSRLTLLLVGTVVLVGMIVVLYEQKALRGTLVQQLERRAVDVGQYVGRRSEGLIRIGDWEGLAEAINQAKLSDGDVRYILIVGPGGEIFADTFGGQVPAELWQGNAPAGAEDTRPRQVTIGGETLRDVASPIQGGLGGVVRVGMSESEVGPTVALHTRNLIALVAIITAGSACVAYGIAFVTTRPLRHLVAAIRSVSAGNLSARISVETEDEVGQLQVAFNTLAADLESKNRTRRRLLEDAIQSQEEERKRVARELHDVVAQQLTGILLSLEKTEQTIPDDSVETRQWVMRARDAADTCLAEARQLMSNLRPALLDDMGLKQAILSYAEDQLVLAGAEVTCDVSGLPPDLPPHVETAVFRILQEAITNAARHSKAKQVSIQIVTDGHYISGTVADNGCGFRADDGITRNGSRGGCLGILGMQERASLLGGALTVVSRENGGTRVSFVIPLNGDG